MIKEKLKKYSCFRKLYRLMMNSGNRSKALHENGYDLIGKIDNIMNSAEIDYFADFGTLLGLIRDGKLIAHDLDMDFGVINVAKEDKQKLYNLFASNNIRRISYFKLDDDIKEETYSYNGLSFDIFYYEKNEDKSFCYIFCKLDGVKYVSENEFTAGIYEYKMNISTINVNIHDINMRIPNDAEKLLEMKYGANWKIPNKYWHYWYDANVTVLNKRGREYNDN